MMDYFDEQKRQEQEEINRKERAELKEKRNQILRALEAGQEKIKKSDFDKLQPVDRLHWARKIKIIGG